MELELEFKMEWSTGSFVADKVEKSSYEEVFGHPQPGFDKKKWTQDKIEWKSLHPGFAVDKPGLAGWPDTGLRSLLPPEDKPKREFWSTPEDESFVFCSTADKLEIVTTGYIGIGSKHPNTELNIEGAIGKIEKIEKIEMIEKIEPIGKIGLACINPSAELDVTGLHARNIGEGKIGLMAADHDPSANLQIQDKIGIGVVCPENALQITPEVDMNSKEMKEKVKALKYDLDRAKDRESENKLIDEFARREFIDLWNSRDVKDKEAEFFNKTWDLTKKLSNNSTDYSDYAGFLEEYFDEGDE